MVMLTIDDFRRAIRVCFACRRMVFVLSAVLLPLASAVSLFVGVLIYEALAERIAIISLMLGMVYVINFPILFAGYSDSKKYFQRLLKRKFVSCYVPTGNVLLSYILIMPYLAFVLIFAVVVVVRGIADFAYASATIFLHIIAIILPARYIYRRINNARRFLMSLYVVGNLRCEDAEIVLNSLGEAWSYLTDLEPYGICVLLSSLPKIELAAKALSQKNRKIERVLRSLLKQLSYSRIPSEKLNYMKAIHRKHSFLSDLLTIGGTALAASSTLIAIISGGSPIMLLLAWAISVCIVIPSILLARSLKMRENKILIATLKSLGLNISNNTLRSLAKHINRLRRNIIRTITKNLGHKYAHRY